MIIGFLMGLQLRPRGSQLASRADGEGIHAIDPDIKDLRGTRRSTGVMSAVLFRRTSVDGCLIKQPSTPGVSL
jgi:hypothetical protein